MRLHALFWFPVCSLCFFAAVLYALPEVVNICLSVDLQKRISCIWERVFPEPIHPQPETRNSSRVIDANGIWKNGLVLSSFVQLIEERLFCFWIDQPIFGNASFAIFAELVGAITPLALRRDDFHYQISRAIQIGFLEAA